VITKYCNTSTYFCSFIGILELVQLANQNIQGLTSSITERAEKENEKNYRQTTLLVINTPLDIMTPALSGALCHSISLGSTSEANQNSGALCHSISLGSTSEASQTRRAENKPIEDVEMTLDDHFSVVEQAEPPEPVPRLARDESFNSIIGLDFVASGSRSGIMLQNSSSSIVSALEGDPTEHKERRKLSLPKSPNSVADISRNNKPGHRPTKSHDSLKYSICSQDFDTLLEDLNLKNTK